VYTADVKWMCLLVVAAACGQPASNATDGASVFASMCATCHGPKGKPDATMSARLDARDLTDPAVRSRLTPASIEHQVRTGSPNKLMPGFEGALTPDQIRAVSAFVASPTFLTHP
jgi:mono/diheme cytochrome c family protein